MNTIVKMLVVLSCIGIISGGSLSMLSTWAAPKIAANRKADTERAIFLVQPEASKYEEVATVDFELYQVFTEDDEAIGYAMPWEGSGFQGKIRLIFGVRNDLMTLTSIEVLDQLETPGLGTKILEEPFTSQFRNLKADPQVDWVKGAPASKATEIETITGATISAKAVVFIINDGLQQLRASVPVGEMK